MGDGLPKWPMMIVSARAEPAIISAAAVPRTSDLIRMFSSSLFGSLGPGSAARNCLRLVAGEGEYCTGQDVERVEGPNLRRNGFCDKRKFGAGNHLDGGPGTDDLIRGIAHGGPGGGRRALRLDGANRCQKGAVVGIGGGQAMGLQRAVEKPDPSHRGRGEVADHRALSRPVAGMGGGQ